MKQQKIKILVACHKPDSVYEDEVYTPIHVGRAISKFNAEMSNMIGDNTGDNISNKNPFYCELTAQYWAWKNLNVEYIGLCHYRRYFKIKITPENIEKEMSGVDMILVKHITLSKSVCRWISNQLIEEDMYIFSYYFKKMHPTYASIFDKYFIYGNIINPCNMFICKKELFDKFAKWQFEFLFKLEKIIKFSEYSRLKRIMGYYGENMLRLYCLIHQLKIKEIPIVPMIGDDTILFKSSYKKNLISNIIFSMKKQKMVWEPAVINGLKNDGLIK